MAIAAIYPPVHYLLPHRGNMLLIDRIEAYSPKCLIASTTVKEDTPFLDGHFPGYPILPGVILVEMMFQTCGLYGGMSAIYGDKLLMNEEAVRDNAERFEAFTKDLKARSIGIDKLMFKKAIFPKDELLIEVTPQKKIMAFSTYKAKITDRKTNKSVVEGTLTVFLGKNKKYKKNEK